MVAAAKKAPVAKKAAAPAKAAPVAKKAPVEKKAAKKATPVKDAPKKRITIAPEGVVLSAKEAGKKRAAAAATKPAAKKLAGTQRNAAKKAEKKTPAKVGGKRKIGSRKSGQKGSDGKVPRYPVLQLRHVHPQFEEPQLIKFFSQFGATVVNTYCVRSKKNHQSKGICYVQFDNNSVLPTVIDEVHGMLLGGFTVRARRVYMTRSMPTKPSIISRRRKAEIIAAQGVRLNRFDVAAKQKVAVAEDPKRAVGYLIKYAEAEKKSNERNTFLGIDYSFTGYQTQLASVKKDLFITKKDKEESKAAKAALVAKKAAEVAEKKVSQKAANQSKKAPTAAVAEEESDSSDDDLSVEESSDEEGSAEESDEEGSE